jgi:hypothetical protein
MRVQRGPASPSSSEYSGSAYSSYSGSYTSRQTRDDAEVASEYSDDSTQRSSAAYSSQTDASLYWSLPADSTRSASVQLGEWLKERVEDLTHALGRLTRVEEGPDPSATAGEAASATAGGAAAVAAATAPRGLLYTPRESAPSRVGTHAVGGMVSIPWKELVSLKEAVLEQMESVAHLEQALAANRSRRALPRSPG